MGGADACTVVMLAVVLVVYAHSHAARLHTHRRPVPCVPKRSLVSTCPATPYPGKALAASLHSFAQSVAALPPEKASKAGSWAGSFIWATWYSLFGYV